VRRLTQMFRQAQHDDPQNFASVESVRVPHVREEHVHDHTNNVI
jgi:hypothetical protein